VDREGSIVSANPRATALGLREGAPWTAHLDTAAAAVFRRACEGQAPAGAFIVEDGDGRHWHLGCHDGQVVAFLEGDGLRSTVTGLPGPELFARRLDRSVNRCLRDRRYRFAVLVVDLHGFRLVNSSLGREAADELLRAVAARLMDTVRPGDEVAQLAGDEFAVLVDRVPDPDTAIAVSSRIHGTLEQPFTVAGHEVFARAGIGVAISDGECRAGSDLLQDAATALARAKARGPGNVEVYEPAMRERAIARLKLDADLRRALERDELLVHFQPIVDLASARTTGFEALLRWQHPERGLLLPNHFLPYAEESGLIVPIATRVLVGACRQLRAWQESSGRPDLTLSMNFTAAHFSREAVVESVFCALDTTGLRAGSMIVEITESALIVQFEMVTEVLRELRARGVRIHLDDFGTGYSSLSYLSRLPVDALKVDRAFVSQLAADQDARVLVRAILDLARSLQKETVGEGIEQQEQAEHLKALGCRYGQGWLYAKAMPAEAVEGWLTANG
jgi:diguanylate cyclase (GGDEF)-like protein